jgi:hypothetical protein
MVGRTILINSSLTNLAIYHMSMFLLPKTAIKRMDGGKRKFLWQGSKLKKSYHLVRWDKICRAKRNGGLGIKDLRKLNISLLVKWWWALENEQGLWQDIVRLKYVKGTPVCSIPNRYNDSPVWCDLLKIRQIYLKRRKFQINDGRLVSFWLDIWLGDKSLCQEYSILYDLCNDKGCSVY